LVFVDEVPGFGEYLQLIFPCDDREERSFLA
jgi:hypothetical protein